MVREPRIVPLDGRPHVDPRIRQWMGDARGRWESETLVVETTHFTEKGWITPNQNAGRMHGVAVSRSLRVVERFTRVAEDALDWQVRVEDPEVYTEPWTLERDIELHPLRVRLPRGQPGREQHPGQRPRPGTAAGAVGRVDPEPQIGSLGPA